MNSLANGIVSIASGRFTNKANIANPDGAKIITEQTAMDDLFFHYEIDKIYTAVNHIQLNFINSSCIPSNPVAQHFRDN